MVEELLKPSLKLFRVIEKILSYNQQNVRDTESDKMTVSAPGHAASCHESEHSLVRGGELFKNVPVRLKRKMTVWTKLSGAMRGSVLYTPNSG